MLATDQQTCLGRYFIFRYYVEMNNDSLPSSHMQMSMNVRLTMESASTYASTLMAAITVIVDKDTFCLKTTAVKVSHNYSSKVEASIQQVSNVSVAWKLMVFR